MRSVPEYKSPVSLIPGGCLQFLDFSVSAETVGRIRRSFFEEEHPQGEGRHKRRLHCLHEVNGQFVDSLTAVPRAVSYELDGQKCLVAWANVWLPLPFLRLRDNKWPDGSERFECGPGNWARGRFSRAEDGSVALVLAFDMQVEDPPTTPASSAASGTAEVYHALSPADVDAHAAFRLAGHVRDNAWFINAGWVDDWLYTVHKQRQKRDPEPGRELEYLASYLTVLECLNRVTAGIVVQVLNPRRENPVDVDLVLDIGNSRTSGLLVETLPQRATNLNDSYLLQLRDLSRPGDIHTDPFETRVEFSEASFGNDSLSLRSGRRTPAFAWPSAVRVGPEAARLATMAVCAQGLTGLSSPKRYLWDERPWQQSWRCNKEGGPEPMATHGLLARRVNSMGTPLLCMDDRLFTQNPRLRSQERDVAFESHYTRSSLMLFMLVEILLQALTTINSPGQRSLRELPNLPRRLRRIIFTVPPAMPMAEQRIYRRWVQWAVRVLWDTLGWSSCYGNSAVAPGGVRDYRSSPAVQCNWDEATCTQLVYLYNELNRKFQGDAHHLFTLTGRPRETCGNRPCMRVATLDIGGGTTDLAITTFVLESDESDTARIRPQSEFRDGFNLAGDDILREIVTNHVLPAIGDAAKEAGITDGKSFLGRLFGRDTMGGSQEARNLRAQFARQVAAPVALGLLGAYEKANLLAGGEAFTVPLGQFFSGDHPLLPARPTPSAAVIAYVENEVQRLTGKPFALMAVPVMVDARQIDATVQTTLARPLSDLCEVIQHFDCDVLLLTGRPSRWNGVIAPVLSKVPVPPDRILPMCRYRVGNWYPFADALGHIADPKTTVVVGAILCALAEGQLEGFSFDTAGLQLKSTARYIGEMDITGQLRTPKVWFEVDVDSRKELELMREIQFSAPISVGFRQLSAERWPTTRFYVLDFASEEARTAAARKLPYRLTLRLRITASDEDTTDHDEGELFIDDIQAVDGSTVSRTHMNIRLQTLPLDEGYWLDTGSVFQAV